MPAEYREDRDPQTERDGARHLWVMLTLIAVLVGIAGVVMFAELVEVLDRFFADVPVPPMED